MDIYKITDSSLSPIEQEFSVEKMHPVMGSSLTAGFYFDSIIQRYNETGKLLSPGELGCSLSHLKIYQEIIKKRKPAIIFESDILPKKIELEAAIALCKKNDLDFIHLGWHPFYRRGIYFKGKFNKQYGLYEIDPYIDFHGAFAYYVSERCAKNLLEFHNPMIMPADLWSVFFQRNNIKPYFYPIFEHPEKRGSIDNQRSVVSTKVFALIVKNFCFYLNKIIIRKLGLFRSTKKIRPNIEN